MLYQCSQAHGDSFAYSLRSPICSVIYAFFITSITFTPARPWYHFTTRQLFASVLCHRNSSCCCSSIGWIIM